MEEYDYRGYSIEYNPEGNYEIDIDDCVFEFISYEEATEWVDNYLEEYRPNIHTYHIYYATKDRGYDEFIKAYTSSEAENKLRQMYKDLLYITDIYEVEE